MFCRKVSAVTFMWNYSNSGCNNARTFVHSERFQKMSWICAKTLFFYWSIAIKIKTLPSAFSSMHFLLIFFFFLSSFWECLYIEHARKATKIFRPFSEFQQFYSFTIIGDNFVLCFYDCNKFRFFALLKRKKACTVENRRKIYEITFFMHRFLHFAAAYDKDSEE